MNYRGRIRLLLSISTYRTRWAFFVVLGGAVFIASFLATDAVLRDILRQFALTFVAVGAVDFVWDILGGDPLELQLARDFGEVDSKIEDIQRSMAALSDIVDGNIRVDSKIENIQRSMAVLADIVDGDIGIERIWINRGTWKKDKMDGFDAWRERVCEASSIEIVSTTWTHWFSDETFRTEFFDALKRGAKAHVLIYDPHSDMRKLRASDENDSGGGAEMLGEIRLTLMAIADNRAKLPDEAKQRLSVRLTNRHYQLAQIIRADNKMLIANYLTNESGSESPTFQLRGPGSTYYQIYKQQIEYLWKDGREVNDNDIRQLFPSDQGSQS
jgi:hypothetical protein